MKIILGKISTWLAFHFQNGNLRLLAIVTAVWLGCFIQPITGQSYTSWDTHDLGFVNFLYFSDSLRNGTFPLWNPFIQAGTDFPNFNNIGFFSPFQIFFVALSWAISPVYAYELMIQAAVLIGGAGSYLLCRTYTNDRLIALFGAIAFAVVVLVPIVGQVSFVVSLSSVPWLIFASLKITESRRYGVLRYIIFGVLGALYLVSGYLWMNLMHLIVVAICLMGLLVNEYLRAEAREKKAVVASGVSLMIFFGTIALLYGCLMFPGYLSVNSNYSLFSGDYENPEPRLRSLIASHHYSYSSIYKALVGAVDPRIIINDGPWMADAPRWSLGAGWVLWILFLAVSTRKFLGMQIFWIGLVIVALLYSAGDSNFTGKLIEKTPILNANRWWFLGVTYATICLVFLAIPRLVALKERAGHQQQFSFLKPAYDFQILLVGALSIYLLAYFKSSAFEFVLVMVIVQIVILLGRANSQSYWNNLLTLLIGISVFAIAHMPNDIPSVNHYLAVGNYSQQVQDRVKDVSITKNFRRLGEGQDYRFNDVRWLLEKIPFSHGYNNLGNPYVWYVKNEPFLERLVDVTQDVRQEKEVERKNFTSDKEFAVAMMGDALADMGRPTIDAAHFRNLLPRPDFKWQLNELKVEPNTASMQVTTDAPAFLIFNNVDHPGWDVYVNGKQAELVRTNHIFQGVYLEGEGSYDVVFKFRPALTIALLMLPYIVLFICLIAYWQKMRNRGKLRAS